MLLGGVGQPLASTVTGCTPRYIKENPFTRALFNLEEPWKAAPITEAEASAGYQRFVADGLCHIIVKPCAFKAATWNKARRIIAWHAGPPATEGEGCVLYRIRQIAGR